MKTLLDIVAGIAIALFALIAGLVLIALAVMLAEHITKAWGLV